MGGLSVPPSASNAIDDRPLPHLGLPELMLQKMGYYQHPVLYVSISSHKRLFHNSDPMLNSVMLCLFASPLVVLYPICRQYCDADSCRYYRSNTFYILVLFFMFIIWRALNRKEEENSHSTYMTGTQQREERTEKV
jgi:hypothetical protein